MVDLEDLQMITDCSEANVSPTITIRINGKRYYLNDEDWEVDEEGDLIFEGHCFDNAVFNLDTATFKEVEKIDIETIRGVLNNIPKDDLVFDEGYYGWLLWGEKPLDEWFFEEGYCILNPKELVGYMEDIIENELKIKR